MSTSSSLRDGASVRRIATGEDGAVAVVVAISLIMFFGFAALAIDLGSAWSTKRDLNTDLDAAALAGARTLADEVRVDPSRCAPGTTGSASLNSDVRASVRGLLAANGGRANVADSDITIDCDRRTVTVGGSQEAVTVFAGLLGVNEINPAGYAIARAVEGEGGDLMPLSFCVEGPQIQQFAGQTSPGLVLTIPFQSASPNICGGGSLNAHWGYWGAGNANALRNWVNNGPPSVVNVVLPPPEPPQCDALTSSVNPGWCSGDTGHKNTVLQALRDNRTCSSGTPSSQCQVLTFLVHDILECSGNCGSKADYKPYAFLDAIVRDVRANPASSASITLEFVEFRREPGASSRLANSSSLCSADGAPTGDPNCD